jgi:hypothetical protein
VRTKNKGDARPSFVIDREVRSNDESTKSAKAADARAISSMADIITQGLDGISSDLIKYPGYTIEDAKTRARIRLEDAKNVVMALEQFCK